MGHDCIEWTDAASYLGVALTSKMSWTSHINKTAAKARRTLGFLRRNIGTCPRPIKQKAYMSLVRPIVEYAGLVWDPHCQQNIHQLEKVQRSAARFVMGKRHKRSAQDQDSVTDMVAELGWQSLRQRRQIASVTMLYKIQNGLSDISPNCIPKPAPPRLRRGHPHQVSVPQTSLISYQNSFVPRAAHLWNSLPEAAVTAPSLATFKNNISKWSQGI